MNLRFLLHQLKTWIYWTTPTTKGESDGQIQEGFPRLGRSTGRQRKLTTCSRFCLLRWLPCCAGRKAPRTWRSSVARRKGCCEESCGWSTGFPVTTPSAVSFACWTRGRSRSRFGASWWRLRNSIMIDLTGVIAIDGKALRGAYERGRSATPLHMVNVFAAEARMALASIKAPGRNEVLGALEVLQMLHLKHCIVTADALHCHQKFAASVLERGGQYVLALKQNQSKLYAAVGGCFARAGARSSAEWLEPCTHDRREWRRATVMRNTSLAVTHNFPGIVAVARVTSRRRLHGARAEKPFVRYYLLSKSHRRQEAVGGSCAVTGQSRTSCTGCSMSSSTRTPSGAERTMPRKTSRFFASSRSTSSVLIQLRTPCARKSSAQVGTIPSCLGCSAICDSPAVPRGA